MPRLCFLTIVVVLLQVPTQALELTSVSPIRAEPETLVTLSGGPFTPLTRIFFGVRQLPPRETEAQRMTFLVPVLPPGSYALRVSQSGQAVAQSYRFEILEPTPRIIAISPRTTDSCFDSDGRRISVEGKGFLPETVVLLNGAAVAKRFAASDRLEFVLRPGLRAGVYGVQLKNPAGAVSLPYSLWISDTPEIYSVERGDDFVNHYEVIVRGKNFYFDSILTVSRPASELPDVKHRPLILHAHETSPGSLQYPLSPQSDRIVYRDCRTLVYQRYPVSYQDQELQLQVINPDGKKSDPFTVSLP